MGCCSYQLYRLFQTPHSFSVTIFTLGLRLFFNPAANKLDLDPDIFISFIGGNKVHPFLSPGLLVFGRHSSPRLWALRSPSSRRSRSRLAAAGNFS